jgi:hypothetical protein
MSGGEDVSAMFAVEDEAERVKARPDAELNVEAPADKPEPERDESGKFKGKEEKPEAKDPPKEEKPEAKEEEAKKKSDSVPLAAFLEKTNKLKAELEQRDITLAEYKRRLDALEAKAAPKPEEPREPDFVEDPKGYVDHKMGGVLAEIAKANEKAATEGKKAQETASKAQEQVELQRFFTDLQQHEARFVQSTPDYHDALAHLRNVRANQLREFNPEISQEEIVATIRQEETTLAVQLARQGRDPVQTAYNVAKHFGYVKKQAPPPAATTPPPDKRLPPDQTLGTGVGAVDTTEASEPDPIDIALASLARKRA